MRQHLTPSEALPPMAEASDKAPHHPSGGDTFDYDSDDIEAIIAEGAVWLPEPGHASTPAKPAEV